MSRLEYQPNPQQDPDPNRDSMAEQSPNAARRLSAPTPAQAADPTPESSTRFHQVEEMLRKAPLLSVPIGFADRVLAAIKRQNPANPNYQDAMGIILGIFLAALLAIPLLGTPSYLIGRAIINADYRDTLIDDLGNLAERVFIGLETLSFNLIWLIPILAILALLFGFLSTYLYRFIKSVLQAAQAEASNESPPSNVE